MRPTNALKMYAVAVSLIFAGYGANAAGPSGTAANSSSAGQDWASSVPAPGAIKAPEVKDVVVQGASPAPNIGYLAMYVGQKMGYFQDEGLNLKINYSHGDSAPLQAISTGQAQIMSGTPEALIHGYEKGLRGVLFYQTYYKLIFSVAVPQDGKIRSPADLSGKTIGVSSMASTALIIAKVAVKEAGGDPGTVKFLPVGTGQQALGALKSGQVDALALWDAVYSQIETVGDLKLIYWQPKSLESVGDGGYFTSWELIKAQPNTLAHFARAIAKSMVAIHDNPDKALRIYWEVNPSAKPKGTDAEALQIGLRQLDVVGRSLDLSGVPKTVDKASLEVYVQTFLDQGLIRKAPPVDEIVTNAFVPIATQAANEVRGSSARR